MNDKPIEERVLALELAQELIQRQLDNFLASFNDIADRLTIIEKGLAELKTR